MKKRNLIELARRMLVIALFVCFGVQLRSAAAASEAQARGAKHHACAA